MIPDDVREWIFQTATEHVDSFQDEEQYQQEAYDAEIVLKWLDSQPTAAEFDKRLLHLLDINLEAQQRIADLEDELGSQPVAPEPDWSHGLPKQYRDVLRLMDGRLADRMWPDKWLVAWAGLQDWLAGQEWNDRDEVAP